MPRVLMLDEPSLGLAPLLVEMLGEIVKNLSQSLDTPLTAKMRVLDSPEKTLEIARIIEKAGADAITVHARLATQGYNVPADWEWIKKLKKEIF